MPAKNNRVFSLALVICDFLVLVLAFTVAYILRVQYDSRPLVNQIHASQYLLSFLAVIPCWIVIFACFGLYSSSTYNRRLVSWAKIIIGCVVGIMLIITWEYIGNEPIFPARLVVVYALIASCLLIILEREAVQLIRRLFFMKGYGISRVLLIGSTPTTLDVAKHISDTPKSGYQLVAIAGPKKYVPKNQQIKQFDNLEDALKSIKRHRITSIIQTDLFQDRSKNQAILFASQSNHIRYNFIPGEPEFYSGQNTVDVFLGYPIITVSQTPLTGWNAIFKRLLDIAAIILTFPIWGLVFLIVILCQKLFNPGPIFFKQYRLGRYKKRFSIYKFRSMKQKYCGQDAITIFKEMGREDLAKEYSKTRKIKNDPRISTFGKIIRKASIDELAQIINVIKGDMSLVGPRPILPDEVDFYKSRSPLLLSVKPGLTSLASVSGRSDLSFDKRVDLELMYAQNWSFLLDLKIIIKTVKVVLLSRGAE
jgi:exopolysaccharide biosynthesis polyprenyl glycosylphosphotransferase